jgi:hypothetical protein
MQRYAKITPRGSVKGIVESKHYSSAVVDIHHDAMFLANVATNQSTEWNGLKE